MASVFFLYFKKWIVVFLLALMLILFLFIAYIKFFYPICFYNSVVTYCNEYNLDREFVIAVINCESGFDKCAVSKSGALGLMQIMPDTARDVLPKVGEGDYSSGLLFDDSINIKVGCYYLNYLQNKYVDKKAVLYAYNAGEGNLQKELIGNPTLEISKIEIEETRKYISKVLSQEKVYKKLLKFYK